MAEEKKKMSISVRWFCGCYKPSATWQSFDYDEPDDCMGETDTEEDEDDFREGDCSAECSVCGAILQQSDGHATEIKPNIS